MILGTAGLGIAGIALPEAAQAATSGSQTFGYSSSTQTFTVPTGVTLLTMTALGGEGGLGGADGAGNSYPGGYQGQVTGTIAVTPGQTITIGVGHGGANGANNTTGLNSPTNYASGAAAGGTNPVGGYNGGNGGVAGFQGASGDAGGGGAATVVQVGSSVIVAGGSGGAGGSGQYAPTKGRAPYSTFTAAPTTTTAGQVGITIYTVCNNAPSPGCDGGGGGPGGGGAQGGSQGTVQFGSGSSNEWYGYGGYPGSNSTASLSGLTASYVPYSDNASNGSVAFTWSAGVPDAPTNVAGTAGNQSVGLTWAAPAAVGGSVISDYVVQYELASNPNGWTTVDTGSTNLAATITGLTNSVGYVFEVAAVNGNGQGAWSSPSATITPIGPPPAPVISAITPADGALSVAFTQSAPAGSATVIGYQYSLDGGTTWVSAGVTSSPLTVSGLTNGTAYPVRIRAVSSVGNTAASSPVTGTPAAVPGAPTITSISTSPEAAAVSVSPGYAGGGTVTGYEYQLNGTGAWTSGGSSSPINITGLADGTTYTVAVRTDSTSGTSSASTASSFTTPSVPGAPTVAVTSGDTQLSIAYAAGSPGGATITGYQYSLDGGQSWVTAGASPVVVTGLTNGTTYSVSVRAQNAIGNGTGSAPQSAVPATVPSAPTITTNNVAGSGQLSVGFTAPTSNGGAAISNYQYSTDAGATWRAFSPATTASPVVISTLSSDGTTALTNTTYPIELRAVNSAGVGVASATNDGTPATVPAAPTLTSVVPGSGSLQVTFTPAANGGLPITQYQYTLDGSTWQSTGTLGSSFTVTGLTNGTTYNVQVEALNSLGASSPSNVIVAMPSTTAAQPTITGVVRSNHSLTLSVNDANNGGAAITDYQYSTDGGATWHSAGSATSPLTITTLSTDGTTQIANGTSYPVQVRAVNAAGVSVASTTTNVGPAAPPGAPIISLTPHDQALQVTFSIPNDGGAPVSAIEYQVNNGAWADAGTLSSPFTISGLTDGTAYTVNVRADNAIGNGTASNPATATPYTVPGAPTSVSAISDTASADVSWSAPASNGGSVVTGYTATAYTDPAAGTSVGTACATPANTPSCSIIGLTNGTTYYVSVVANNAAGAGSPSSPRSAVVPLARPAAPTLGSITAADSTLSVPFTFPTGYLNGSTLVTYQYQLNGGAWVSMSTTTSPLLITGLTDGTSYTVAMRAVSAAGNGVASAASAPATPFTYPTAPNPSSIVNSPQNTALLVSWAAPNNNGSAITSYTATAFNALTAGSQVNTCTTAALSCTITGLTNGTTYYVSMQATNAAGASVRSSPRVAGTPAAVPNAPTGLSGVPGNGQVALSWTAPANNGSAITDYTVYYSTDGVNYTVFNDGVSTATTATVTGLTNGTAYMFDIAAVNGNGTGPYCSPSAYTPLAAGVTPTLSTATSTNTGYTFSITNYDSSTTYSFAATNSASATRSGSTVTVTGLAPGASSTVTVSATKAGFSTTSAQITGSAIPMLAAPTFGTATKSAVGYTVPIANYDSTATYSATATAGTATTSGGFVVVVGLAPSGSSTITLTAAKSGYQNSSGTFTSTALGLGTAPTYSNLTSTSTGFTVTIANYNASYVYSPAVPSGPGSVTRNGANLTVTGLAAGQSATVTVGVTNGQLTFATSSVTGSAFPAGIAPTFGTVTRTADGFTVPVTNFDNTAIYSLGGITTGAITMNGATVIVFGVAPGVSDTATLTVVKTGFQNATASVTGTALAAGTAPTFSAVAQAAGGYTFSITNYDPSLTYTLTAGSGASASVDSSGLVTVTGLAPGTSSSVLVAVVNPGVSYASASTSGSALLTGTAPTLSMPTSTSTGYTFSITNYDPSTSYTFGFSPSGAAASVNSSGLVTVTGIAPGASATTTVSAARTGYTTATASVSGSAIPGGIAPTFGTVTRTADGFTVPVTNFDNTAIYSLGGITTGFITMNGATVIVFGVAPGVSDTATLTVVKTGFQNATASVTGTALAAGTAPTFSAVTQTAVGYTFSITNYDASLTYTLTAGSGASASVDSSGLVTVTGLAPGASSSVLVAVVNPGLSYASATTSGSALLTGSTPVLTTSTAANGGFVFGVSNYDPDYTYSVTSSAGSATIDSNGVVTVAGLAAGQATTVTVTATRTGYTTLSAQLSGAALLSGTGPTLSAATQTDDGFTFTITNFDPNLTYAATTTGGAVLVDASGVVTVSGLAPGADATVIVVVSQAGHLDAAGSVHAGALMTGSTPTFSTPTHTNGGFTVTITNYDPTYTYTVTSTAGTVAVGANGVLTITGLAPGAAATLTATTTKAGYAVESATVTSSAATISTTPTTSPVSATPTVSTTPTASSRATAAATPTATATSETPPTTSELPPGDGAVTVDGRVVHSTLTPTATSEILRGVGGLTMEISALVDGKPASLSAAHVITVPWKGQLHVTVKGFRAGSTATVWGFSTATLLTKVTITSTQGGAQGFDLPDSMLAGNHTIVVTGTAADGKAAQMKVGFTITKPSTAPGTTPKHPVLAASLGGGSHGSTGWLLWALPVVVLAAFLPLFVAWRRRRDDEQDLAPITWPYRLRRE